MVTNAADTAVDNVTIALRDGADPSVLVEVRRHLGQPFAIERVSAPAFDRYLQARYTIDQSAAGLAGTIDRNDDLDALADQRVVLRTIEADDVTL